MRTGTCRLLSLIGGSNSRGIVVAVVVAVAVVVFVFGLDGVAEQACGNVLQELGKPEYS
jgi:hypothetical protein